MKTESPSRVAPSFLDLDGPFRDPDGSQVVVLPVPFERTTSYRKGTVGGPTAVLAASQQVELYDEELRSEPYRQGIATLPPVEDHGESTQSYLRRLGSVVQAQMEADKFVLCLGGEHTLTQAAVAAAEAVHGDIGVVQFDAHADLRASYEATPFSHACVMRRIHETGVTSLAVGVRSLSPEEAEFVEQNRLPILWGWQLDQLSPDRWLELLAPLPPKVYLTFDVDFLDPSLVPATGTPEPGGGRWWPSLALLRSLFREKQVVAMDLVELAPIPDQPASDFTVARLAYKCLAYRQRALERG